VRPRATAIAYALQQIETPRPMTHDLISDVTKALGAKVFCAQVTDLREGTFYAALRLILDGREIEVDCRPSDAIATALRVSAPILVADELMNEYGRQMDLSDEDLDDDEEQLDPDELLEEMRAFLDDVRPEDFEA
jgi:bifunctional DNase/RNase